MTNGDVKQVVLAEDYYAPVQYAKAIRSALKEEERNGRPVFLYAPTLIAARVWGDQHGVRRENQRYIRDTDDIYGVRDHLVVIINASGPYRTMHIDVLMILSLWSSRGFIRTLNVGKWW